MISFPSFLFTQLLYLSSSQYVIKIWVKTEKKTLFNKKNNISRFLIIYYKLFFDLICFSSVLLKNKLKATQLFVYTTVNPGSAWV